MTSQSLSRPACASRASHSFRAMLLLAGAAAFSGAAPTFAQTPPAPPTAPSPGEAVAKGFAVLPREHPAYAAILTLTKHGMLDGMPPEADPFNGRTVTRLEMASLVSRLITHLEKRVGAARANPAQAERIPVEHLRLARDLVQEFRSELALIGVDLKRVSQEVREVAALSDTPVDPAAVQDIQSQLAQVLIDRQKEGDEESLLLQSKNRITGYFQFRLDALIGDRDLFRSTGAGGTGQRPSLNGPAVGGPSSAFLVRRGRIRIGEQMSPRDEFVFQADLPTNSAPNVRDAFVRVLNFPARNMAFRAGQFAFNYGWEYVASSRNRETPERALGYSDSSQASLMYKQSVAATGGTVTPGSVVPFFLNQDRDIGVELAWAAPWKRGIVPRGSVAVIMGEGRGVEGQRSLNSAYDLVLSAEVVQTFRRDQLNLGLSYYNGWLPVRAGAPENGTPTRFVNASRAFGGLYVRYTRPGQEYRAEYSGGRYDVTPDRARYLPRNTFQAWYVVTRQTVAKNTEVFLKYDEFAPVKSGTVIEGVRGDDLTRKTLSLGAAYQLTKATRFKVNYSQGLTPYDASAPAGSLLRKKIGLLQTEIQMVY
jgi:hypothetical protein